jgi:nucleoside-diphosphate-sugar epimerase
MEDAIRATIEIMHVPAEKIKIRGSYNLAGISFTPAQIAAEIQKHIPDFKISYKPDFRQDIANSWPQSISEIESNQDWGWKQTYNLESLVSNMLENLSHS